MHGQAEIPAALLDGIYAAAADDQLWPSVIREISALTHSIGGILLGQSQQRNTLLFNHQFNVSQESIHMLGERHVLNPWTLYMWRHHPVGTVVPSDRILSTSELQRTEFFNDVLRPQGASHGVMLGLAQRSDFGVGFSLNRTLRQGPYDEQEVRFLTDLAPHLRRSIQLGFRVDAYKALQRGACDALDHLAIGVILLDGQGKIIFANAAARALEGTGAPLRLSRGHVSHVSSGEARRIDHLVQMALAGAPMGTISVPRPDDGYPLTILATPVRGQEVDRLANASMRGAAVLLFLFDPASTGGIPAAWLMEAYGLTHAEANIAIAVSMQGTIPNTARALNLSPNTIKTHLRGVFGKMDISHQVELARHIASLAAVRSPELSTGASAGIVPPPGRRG